MDRFFTWLQRFNSLIPLLLLLIGLGAVSWSALKSYERTHPTITPPADGATPHRPYWLGGGEYFDKDDAFVLRLYGNGEDESEYGGGSKETRNILVVSEKFGKTYWLFKDQSQVITQFDQILYNATKDQIVFALASPLSHEDSLKASSHGSLYLIKLDGSAPKFILSNVDAVIHRRNSYGKMHLIYESGSTIRMAKISLSDLKLLSDKELSKTITP